LYGASGVRARETAFREIGWIGLTRGGDD